MGFFSQTGIQFLFSLSRTSFRFGPIFFMSCIRLWVWKSSCWMRPSILLFATRSATAFWFRRLASSLLDAASACFIRYADCFELSFFCCSNCLICCAIEVRSSGSLS